MGRLVKDHHRPTKITIITAQALELSRLEGNVGWSVFKNVDLYFNFEHEFNFTFDKSQVNHSQCLLRK